MKKFEYKIIDCNNKYGKYFCYLPIEEREKILNEMGSLGWRFISPPDYALAFFEREINDSSKDSTKS